MNPREQGFLLLTSKLGNPDRRPMTIAQFRTLASRVTAASKDLQDRELERGDLIALGYDAPGAERITALLSEEALLQYYLVKGKRMDCTPITRVSSGYPVTVRTKLGLDSPGCLWAKGNLGLLELPKISLVGSRNLRRENGVFAREAGKQAALQGYVLVSGNARGADRQAQQACLEHGGKVICVVADALEKCPLRHDVLYLSEDSFDSEFSIPRALSRNRIIHVLGQCVLVAQSDAYRGGTWGGTVKNLKKHWSPVFCFQDGSEACRELNQMGAEPIQLEDLADLQSLKRSNSQIKMEELL